MDYLLTFLDAILSWVGTFIDSFNAYAKENQMVAGAVSLWFLGVMSFLLKGVPRFLFETFLRHTTTELTMLSANDSFHNFVTWYQDNGYSKKSRRIKISNGRYGDDKSIKSLGYGKHYIWFKRRLLMIELSSKDASATEREKEQITITKIGRSHKIFDILFTEIKKNEDNSNNTILKKYDGEFWERAHEQRPRSFDSIFLSDGVKDKLINHLDQFKSREQWYLDHGIPYQTGIILYGPPGTGKTSLIKAIANYLNYSLNILPASSLFKIQQAMLSLPEKSIIMIEDIDRDSATNIKKSVANKKTPKGMLPKIKDDDEREEMSFVFSLTSMSDVLNAMDGVHSVHGRILIITTNNIDKLDPTLLRPGRIDLRLYLGYVNHFILNQFVNSFYPGESIPDGFKTEDNLSSAEIQNRVQENLTSFPDFLESISEKNIITKSA